MFTPYCALFGRHPTHPCSPGVINLEKDGDSLTSVWDSSDEKLEAQTAEVADLHAKVMVKWQYISIYIDIYLNYS